MISLFLHFKEFQPKYGSSHSEVSVKKVILKISQKLTIKHLCQSLFFNKVAGFWHRYFPVNIAKFLTSPVLIGHF